ncbi:MAG: hypothetical protein MUF00_01650 [Gemmatimonadaceae bacterium]|jgi:hypothetical protein|nr:hypothetical protein [Gemmatimonadaceae bacterium]
MTVDSSTLSGWFKDRYEDSGIDLVPETSEIAQSIPFRAGTMKLGNEYVFNVRVRRSQGITFGGTSATAFALNAVRSGQTDDGRQAAYQMVMREQIAYGVISRAQSSVEAFGNAFDEIVRDVTNSFGFYREMQLLYGGSSIGTITAGGLGAVTSANIVITEASWAAGLWSQMEGAAVDVYSAPGGTQRNTTQAVVIGAVNFDNRTIAITGAAADLNAIQANDVIIPFGADGNWANGFDVLVPSSSTQVHGINPATYGLWQGNTISAGSAALTFAKINSAASRIASRAGMGKLVCRVSPLTWGDLNDDVAALRRYAAAVKSGADLGTQSIKFYSQTGELEIRPHPMVKAGEAFLTMDSYFKRIGSADISFRLPGVEGQQPRFFKELDDVAALEMRAWSDQALVVRKRSCHAKINNIVNSLAV